jgi:hypothetical protein
VPPGRDNEIRSYGSGARYGRWWGIDSAYGSRKECAAAQEKSWIAEAARFVADSSVYHIETPFCEKDKCSDVRATWWTFGVAEVSKQRPDSVRLTFKPPPGGYEQSGSAVVQSGYLRTSFVCLPDTIDPRSPKGK